MSDQLQNDSELELVDKVAVAIVFLLAGLLLWQFMGNKDASINLSNQEEWSDTTDSETSYAYQPSSAEPAIKTNIEEISTIKPSKVELPAVAKPVKKITETAKEVINPVVAKPVEQVKKIIEPVVEVKKIATPTIRPVTSDLSQGLLKLSGTGEPGSYLQLMLNGQRSARIDIKDNGEWSHEAKLEPGAYSVQVLPPKLTEQMNSQSALTNITIPEPEVEKELPVKQAVIKEVAPVVKEIVPQIVTPEPEIQEQPLPAVSVDVPDSSKMLDSQLYRVKYGDTLNKLARRYNVTLETLVQSNDISDKDVIEVGQLLVIPGHFSEE